MNLDDMNESVNKTDTLLQSIKRLLKKNWGIILILLVGGFIYWSLNQPDDPESTDDSAATEQVEESGTDDQGQSTEDADDNSTNDAQADNSATDEVDQSSDTTSEAQIDTE